MSGKGTRDFVVADPLDVILTALALSLRCLPRFDQGLTGNPFDEMVTQAGIAPAIEGCSVLLSMTDHHA